jgi:hypothetical protein
MDVTLISPPERITQLTVRMFTRRIFGSEKAGVQEGREIHKEGLHHLYSSPNKYFFPMA